MYNDRPKTKYVMYSKSGREIMEADSFFGFIVQTALASILGPLLIMIPIAIIISIINLFWVYYICFRINEG